MTARRRKRLQRTGFVRLNSTHLAPFLSLPFELVNRVLLAIVIGFALTVLFYLMGAFLSGGGHDLDMITTFFPYSLSLGILTEGTRWARGGTGVAGALLVLQFPVYAIVFAISKRRLLKWPLIILVCLHFLAVLIGLYIYHASRSSYFYGAIQQVRAA